MRPRVPARLSNARSFFDNPRAHRAWPVALALLGVMAPLAAFAADVVLPPLVPRTGTELRDVSNLTALLSTELDFLPEVENVIELPKIPATLTVTCLDQPGCLGAIGKQAGGSHLVAGTLRVTPEKVTLDLVYFDVVKGRTLRRQAFDLVNKPEIIADNMDDVVRELITGQAPKAAAEATASSDSFNLLDFDEDEEIGFDQDSFKAASQAEAAKKLAAEAEAAKRAAAEAEAARRAAAEAEAAKKLAAEAEARRRAEEQARLAAEAEARRRAEEQARAEAARRAEEQARAEAARRAEEQARAEAARRAEEQARAAAARQPPPPAEDEFDPSMISFGSAAIIVEEGAAAPTPPAKVVQTPPPSSKPSYYDEDEPPELDEPSGGLVDLDAEDTGYKPASRPEPARPAKATPSRTEEVERVGTSRPAEARSDAGRSTSAGSTAAFDDAPTAVQVTARAGYSPYYNLGFVTAGAEISVALGESGVHFLGGVEAWNVNRQIPPDFQVLAGRTTEWNTIFPVSAGVVYKLGVGGGRVKPYAGADLIAAQYYVPRDDAGNSAGSSWAVGARARGGVDLMVQRSFGFNVNVAVGGWTGGDWEIIEKDVRNAGLLPQVSVGTVLAF